MGGEDLDGVAADAEGAADEVDVAALVLLGDEVGEQLALVEAVADGHLEGHGGVGLDRADAVDAGDRGDDDAVVALEERARRRVAHAVDLLVDRRFLLDIGVGARHVGLGLVVVVVGDEVLDRVVGEEVLELAIELGGQRLVRRQDQRRALRRLDHLGHGEGLARAGDAEQDLVALAVVEALDEVGDGGRLVAGGLVVGDHADRDAALRLFRPGRAVRRPDLAVLVQRIAGFDQLGEGLDGGGDGGAGVQRRGVLEVDVEAGDRVEAGGGAGLRIGGGADRDAAGGFLGGHRALLAAAGGFLQRHLFRMLAGGVFHLLAVLAGLRGDLALALHRRGLGVGLELLHPVGDAAGKGRAFEIGLRGFLETGIRGGGFLRRSGHGREYGESEPERKGGKEYKRETKLRRATGSDMTAGVAGGAGRRRRMARQGCDAARGSDAATPHGQTRTVSGRNGLTARIGDPMKEGTNRQGFADALRPEPGGRLADRPALPFQRLHDLRLVRASEGQGRAALARRAGELGHRLLRVLPGGAGEPDRPRRSIRRRS